MAAHQLTPGPSRTQLVLQSILGIGILMALLFLPAGRLDWWMAWIFIGAYLGAVFLAVAILQKIDPELLRARQQSQEDVKPWDRVITSIFGMVLIPLTLVTAGLDQRFGWSASFPILVQILALLVGLLAFGLVFWGMAVNTHFESYVRIQADREHQTITSGPYRFVRHPGYLGMLVAALSIPLTLGSWWALIPGGGAAALMVIRTAWEDRTLQAELPGYRKYAQRTRYRLIPGIW